MKYVAVSLILAAGMLMGLTINIWNGTSSIGRIGQVAMVAVFALLLCFIGIFMLGLFKGKKKKMSDYSPAIRAAESEPYPTDREPKIRMVICSIKKNKAKPTFKRPEIKVISGKG